MPEFESNMRLDQQPPDAISGLDESQRNSQYSMDHNLYIAEKEVFLNFYKENTNSVICLTILIVKFYIHTLMSINIRPTIHDMPVKLQSTFTQILNSNKLSRTLAKKAEFFEEFLSFKNN